MRKDEDEVYNVKAEYPQPPPVKCPHCGRLVTPEWFGAEYKWLYICDPCEINWK